MESMSTYMSWDPTLFDLDGYQSPMAGSDSSALEEAFDIHQVFDQVFPEEVEHNRSFLSSIRPDLQEQLVRDINVRVDLVGRSLDNGLIPQGPPRAAAQPPQAPSPPSPPSPQSPPSLRAQSPEPKSLEELDRDLAMALRPHYTEGGASKDKLSSLQQAFFLWKLDVMQIKDTKDLKLKAAVIAIHGEAEGIWLPGWRPNRSTSLPSYLGERIKTTLRKRRRSEKTGGQFGD
ncbi:uncharacterized protein LOC117552833 isoform X2 [Gymnodraco acuticeps]|nr:uncharacterized protein LOC117552833 isoform X2 [Gymnodraco acuticeps]XP_034082384.1 uncharacterized protein LOC117552833 isoform X2 [Gymnodraco acuticeps]XP_034082385.1 uncharacterized protein LOC117552833 isoform X2 [Gymnodraco acuticeps]